MVAARSDDLVHAASHGMRTASIARPTEHRPHQRRDFEAEHDFDLIARDFLDLAAKLGCIA